MRKFLTGGLVAFLACCSLLMPVQPAYSQDRGCSEGPSADPTEPDCEDVNPSCLEDHDMGPVVAAINAAIASYGGAGAAILQDIPIENQGPEGNCGPGLIVEKAIELLGGYDGAGLYSKNYGNQCHGHSVDLIIFADGCTYDVITGSGGPGQSAGDRLLCCGDPPCQERGCCSVNQGKWCAGPRC